MSARVAHYLRMLEAERKARDASGLSVHQRRIAAAPPRARRAINWTSVMLALLVAVLFGIFLQLGSISVSLRAIAVHQLATGAKVPPASPADRRAPKVRPL